MFLQTEQKVLAPIWQRCFCGCLAVFGVFILLKHFIGDFITSPTPPTLHLIILGLLFSYGTSLFARVAAEGKLSELTPDGKISNWLRAGFGLGTVISLIGETRILISTINGKTVLGTKEGIYLVLTIFLTCGFAYIAIRGKPFTRVAPTPTKVTTDSPVDSMLPSKPTT